MATSSEELSSQADNLRDLISFFKVNGSTSIGTKTKQLAVKKTVSATKPVQHKPMNISTKGAFIDMDSDIKDADYERF